MPWLIFDDSYGFTMRSPWIFACRKKSGRIRSDLVTWAGKFGGWPGNKELDTVRVEFGTAKYKKDAEENGQRQTH
jgi:hypothetical protein